MTKIRKPVPQPWAVDPRYLAGIVKRSVPTVSLVLAKKIDPFGWQGGHELPCPRVSSREIGINLGQHFLNNGFFHHHMLGDKGLEARRWFFKKKTLIGFAVGEVKLIRLC